MSSPFPGMDPYLEQPVFWSEFHSRLIVAIADAVVPSLLPRYYVGVETRTYSDVSGKTKERYLEVREAETDAVITVIEVLPPKNKHKGDGRVVYEAKRQKILDSASHLVEIDLLRSDSPMAMQGAIGTDYRVLVSRSERRPKAELYGFTVQEPIPSFPLPLKSLEEVVMVELQSIVQGVYDRGGYAVRIDYQQSLPGLN
jgi:hypothetical protein